MGWFIDRAGQAEGPFSESSIADAIRNGTVDARTRVCAEGTEAWQAIADLREFAALLNARTRPGKSGTSSGGARPIWAIVASVSTTLVLVLVGVLLWRIVVSARAAEAWRLEERARSAARLVELEKLNAPPKWVNADEVHHNCYTNNSEVSCYFTNLGEVPVSTCTRGRLVQKEAQGVKLESIVLCTGKLQPSETKRVVGPWVGGFAKDICATKSYGSMVLDWSVCKFDTEAVDLPTVRRMARVSAK